MHDHEQPQEKEDRDPIDFGEGLGDSQRLFFPVPVVLQIVQQHQHCGAEDRDGARLQPQRLGEDKGGDHGGNDQ